MQCCDDQLNSSCTPRSEWWMRPSRRVQRQVGAERSGRLPPHDEPRVDIDDERDVHPLDAVADDPAPTVLTNRRHPMDRALEAVKHVPCPRGHNFERHVVLVSAGYLIDQFLQDGSNKRTDE